LRLFGDTSLKYGQFSNLHTYDVFGSIIQTMSEAVRQTYSTPLFMRCRLVSSLCVAKTSNLEAGGKLIQVIPLNAYYRIIVGHKLGIYNRHVVEYENIIIKPNAV